MLRAIWNFLTRSPRRRAPYPPWDVKAGPEVFCHWLATGADIRDADQKKRN